MSLLGAVSFSWYLWDIFLVANGSLVKLEANYIACIFLFDFWFSILLRICVKFNGIFWDILSADICEFITFLRRHLL